MKGKVPQGCLKKGYNMEIVNQRRWEDPQEGSLKHLEGGGLIPPPYNSESYNLAKLNLWLFGSLAPS